MNANPQLSGPIVTDLPTPRVGTQMDTPSTELIQNVAGQQLSVAMTWVSRGLPVIPCSRSDKGPMVAGFSKDATPEQLAPFSDPEQVRAWWTGRFKRAHVGLLTGRGLDGRGLVVIDLDMKKPNAVIEGRYADVASGTDVLGQLAADAGADWPDTYTALTPSGGVHLFFRQPATGPVIGCATGDHASPPHLGPLIDVRGLGGLVIAPGSYSSAQGIAYRRISAPDIAPQHLPPWLLDKLRPTVAPAPARTAPVRQLPTGGSLAERAATGALRSSVDRVETAPDGVGNSTLFSVARWLGELSETAPHILSEAVVHDALLAAARAAGHPERGAARTIRSGWSKGARAGIGGAA